MKWLCLCIVILSVINICLMFDNRQIKQSMLEMVKIQSRQMDFIDRIVDILNKIT